MKRYNAVVGGVYDNSVMVEERDGDWVWWEDVEAQYAELLEALEDMLSGWRYIQQDPTHRGIYGVGWERAQRLAEAAIAKAKGEEP